MNKHQLHELLGRKPWKNGDTNYDNKIEEFLLGSVKENPGLYEESARIVVCYKTPTPGERLRRS